MINGTHACQSPNLMTDLIKTELNFQGAIISDWGAEWDNFDTLTNGMDISAPGLGYNTSVSCHLSIPFVVTEFRDITTASLAVCKRFAYRSFSALRLYPESGGQNWTDVRSLSS